VKDSAFIYLAGLVDGDGSIFVSERRERAAHAHGRYRLFLGVSNSNGSLLKTLERKYKKSVVYWDSDNYRAGRITWEGPKAQALIKKIAPYLLGKWKQADLALSFPLVGKGAKGWSKNRLRIYQKKQRRIFRKMRKLNYRWSMGKTHYKEEV
jgi:hypothetical protein